jgi:hypothetical protein
MLQPTEGAVLSDGSSIALRRKTRLPPLSSRGPSPGRDITTIWTGVAVGGVAIHAMISPSVAYEYV